MTDSSHCHISITKHGSTLSKQSVMSVSTSLRIPQTRKMKDNKTNPAEQFSMAKRTIHEKIESVSHLTAGQMESSVFVGVLQCEVCFCTANQHLWQTHTTTNFTDNSTTCKHKITFVLSFSLSPTALVWPFSAAIMRGVLPTASTQFTCALLPSRSCRHSTWSVNAAAWRGVLTDRNS